MLIRRTLVFTPLCLVIVAFHFVFCETDSYLAAYNEQHSRGRSSKWSRNALNADSCGGIFREKQVLIKSPKYPKNYPKNIDCEYVFYSPFVCINEFHIQFLDFQLEPSLNCSKDKVGIGAEEVLCGQAIGIMKYKATNGTLTIKFTTDQTIENKGFELLVTRLPCASNELADQNVSSTALPTFESNSVPASLQSVIPLKSQVVNTANSENIPETTVVKPVCLGQTINGAINFHPQSATPPSCCINVYNQQKFYLMSPSFPNVPRFPSDCLFHIERFRPNTCRLRIDFNYFLLGDWNPNHCTNNFIEIDGRRFCGCKTGFTYFTQWAHSPKPIRFVNNPLHRSIQGFVLEITQEECPYRSVALLPSRQIASRQLQFENHSNDPRRCSYNYISWLGYNTNHHLLAKSVCIRNYG